MIYGSIDIETTGLNSQMDSILEFACVLDLDPLVPIERLPTYRFVCCESRVSGDPYALAMNVEILKEINALGPAVKTFAQNERGFQNFLGLHSIEKLVVAGKNFGSFDRQFIQQQWTTSFHYRTLDVGSMFARPEDKVPPSLEQCLNRIGFDNGVKHRALDDAQDVIRCVRAFWYPEKYKVKGQGF